MPQDLLPNMPHYPGLSDDGIADGATVPPQFMSAYNDRLNVAPPAQQDNKYAAELLVKYPLFTSSMLGQENVRPSNDQLELDNAQRINNNVEPSMSAQNDMSQAATPTEAIDRQDAAQLASGNSIRDNAALAGEGGAAYSDVRTSANKEKMEVETRADPLNIETQKLAPTANAPALPTEDIPVLAGGEFGTGFVGTDQFGTSGDPSSGRIGQGFAEVVQ